MINLLLGAMLDPLVDIDVCVMADNVDYDPIRSRLRTPVNGDEDEQGQGRRRGAAGAAQRGHLRG